MLITYDLSFWQFWDKLVQGWFMNLDNLLEIVMHYLLIYGMTRLGYQDGFHIVNVLVCIVHIE